MYNSRETGAGRRKVGTGTTSGKGLVNIIMFFTDRLLCHNVFKEKLLNPFVHFIMIETL